MDEALLDEKIERPVNRDRSQPAPTRRRDPVGEIIGADGLVVGMQGLQRVAADRRQAQAALAANTLGPFEGGRGVVAVIIGVPAGLSAWRGVVMIVRVRLHFGHVALQ